MNVKSLKACSLKFVETEVKLAPTSCTTTGLLIYIKPETADARCDLFLANVI